MSVTFFSHHKCATTWFHAYLTEAADRSGLRLASTVHSGELLDPDADLHFYANASYEFAVRHGLSGCHIVRNPASIIVSAYFSHLRTHAAHEWPELARQRKALRSVDKVSGLYLTTAFLERADFYPGAIGPLHGLRGWDYADVRYSTVRMEDLVVDPSSAMRSALARSAAPKPLVLPPNGDFAFSRFAEGREVGTVDEFSHYRSGRPDDWKLHFPAPIAWYLASHFRPLLDRVYPEILREFRIEG